MKYSNKVLLASLGLWATLLTQPAQSHGAHIDYQIAPSVEVQAQFDNGELMVQAQVTVFAPSDPETPWQTGITDDDGSFSFSPDPSQTGDWEVQVRQAGHGSSITIPVGSDEAIASATGGDLSPAQKLLMTGLGLWGLLGTGLYFSNRTRAQVIPARVDKADTAVEPPIPV